MDNRLDLTIDQIYQLGKQGTENLEAGLERVYNATPLGPLASNMVNTVYGINHRQTQLALPFNRDSYGLTFFTRPRLNLTTNNIRFVRQLYPLLNTEPRSIQRIIRTTLDPQIAFGSDPSNKSITSPYVDNMNMFIPLLSNLCLTISGWPDFVVDTRTTPEGHYREVHSMIDSSIEIKNAYELSASFRNIPNNPVTLLFYFWIFYAAKAFEGEIIPYGSSMWEHEIDYNTRIYRLVLDPTKRYVQHIISTGAAFPLNAPVGALGNFDNTQPFNESGDNVNIRFQCIGMEYNDPRQIQDFNDAVSMMNPGMADAYRDQYFIKIPYQILSFFNMRGYPRIARDMELEWYISYSMFQSYAKQLAEFTDNIGMKHNGFLQYISPSNSSDYKKYLQDLDNSTPQGMANGGLIKRAEDGEFNEDQLDQISQAYFSGG